MSSRRPRTARRVAIALVVLMVLALVVPALVASSAGAVPEGPPYPSAEWAEREQGNYARTQSGPAERSADAAFEQALVERSLANVAAYADRQALEPYWRSEGNLCATWGEECVGDPFRYPGVDPFYDLAGEVQPVELHDAQGARLNGRVWAPRGSAPGDDLPGVVIINGSVQAPEPLYWWLAQALVRTGYVVMTFDPRGQGRSDSVTPDGTPGSNVEQSVFETNLVDAVDFFRSTPDAPYPHEGNGPEGTPHNPFWDRIDPTRLGVAGHSAGAIGATVVQGLDPWPGVSTTQNPIDVIVALDNLLLTADQRDSGGLQPEEGPDPVAPDGVTPRVPAMGIAGDYFLTPVPYAQPPDPELKKAGFALWQRAGVPTYQVQVRSGTHYEFSQLARFPSLPWTEGNAMAQHFAVAWFDRWLKVPGEAGYEDADARLLDDVSWRDAMSVYYRSARDLPDRDGVRRACEDVRAGCTDLPDPVERIAGDSRVATAAAVARRTTERADVVVLATAEAYADALVGGPLAAVLDAPLLLSARDRLSPEAAAVVEELDAREVVLLGGEAALSAEVARELAALHVEVRRIAGPDRFTTAALVADEVTAAGGSSTVLLAQGIDADPSRGWPDALSAAGLGSARRLPVLLTATDALPRPTAERLEGAEVLLVGGEAAVSASVEDEATARAASLRRIAGPDRFATNAAVLQLAQERGVDPAIVWAATGSDWPDSLLAGSATGLDGGLVALVPSTRLAAAPAVRDALRGVAGAVEQVRGVGGGQALRDALLDDLRVLLR